MVKRFYAAPELANTVWIFFICGIGYIFVAWDAGTLGDFKVQLILLTFFVLTGLFWVGAKCGTYIEVDIEKKIVGGKVHFIPGKEIFLSDVVELEISGSFAGAITQIYMICKHKNGKLVERGLTSKQMLTKQDLKELILTIHQINPNIKIPEELLK